MGPERLQREPCDLCGADAGEPCWYRCPGEARYRWGGDTSIPRPCRPYSRAAVAFRGSPPSAHLSSRVDLGDLFDIEIDPTFARR